MQPTQPWSIVDCVVQCVFFFGLAHLLPTHGDQLDNSRRAAHCVHDLGSWFSLVSPQGACNRVVVGKHRSRPLEFHEDSSHPCPRWGAVEKGVELTSQSKAGSVELTRLG